MTNYSLSPKQKNVSIETSGRAHLRSKRSYGRANLEDLEATAGVEPAHSGFADRRVNHFATWPLLGRLLKL